MFLLKQKHLYTCLLFDNYFSMVQEINSAKNDKNESGSTSNACIRILFIQTAFFVFFLLTIFLALFTDQLPGLVNLALCNWFFFEDVPSVHYIWISANVLLTMNLIHLLYFCNSGATFSTLYNIAIFSKGDGFFIQPNQRICKRQIHIVDFINRRIFPFCRLYLLLMHISASEFQKIFFLLTLKFLF